MLSSAEADYPYALYAVGIAFRDGDGVAANQDEAIKWLIKAANGGPDADDAADDLAFIYVKAKKHTDAAVWLKMAAGRGVPQDYYEAAKWCYRAAVQGDGFAQFELGMLFNKGIGVPQDFVLAYMWLNLSASQVSGQDRDFKVGIRDSLRSKMTLPQLAIAQELTRGWYKSR